MSYQRTDLSAKSPQSDRQCRNLRSDDVAFCQKWSRSLVACVMQQAYSISNTAYFDFTVALLFFVNLNESVIHWITSFSCNRKQRVNINGLISDWADELSGIPQGTIFCPLLFIIYINDLPDM